jgi:hypothetical protein
MTATVVVAGAVVGGTAALAGAAVAAIVATATAVVASDVRTWWSPGAAGAAALVVTALFDAHPSIAVALATAALFQLVVLSRPSRVIWTAPVVASAVALATTWQALDAAGALAFAAGLAAVVTAAARLGTLPWRSRVVGAWSRRASTRVQRAMVVAAGALAVGLASVALASTSARDVLAPAAAASACGGAAMAMFGVRQWRFAPIARVRDATVVAGCTLVVLLVYLPLALDGDSWALALMGMTVAVNGVIAWTPARLAQTAAAPAHVASREPAQRR